MEHVLFERIQRSKHRFLAVSVTAPKHASCPVELKSRVMQALWRANDILIAYGIHHASQGRRCGDRRRL